MKTPSVETITVSEAANLFEWCDFRPWTWGDACHIIERRDVRLLPGPGFGWRFPAYLGL